VVDVRPGTERSRTKCDYMAAASTDTYEIARRFPGTRSLGDYDGVYRTCTTEIGRARQSRNWLQVTREGSHASRRKATRTLRLRQRLCDGGLTGGLTGP